MILIKRISYIYFIVISLVCLLRSYEKGFLQALTLAFLVNDSGADSVSNFLFW